MSHIKYIFYIKLKCSFHLYTSKKDTLELAYRIKVLQLFTKFRNLVNF